MRTILFVCTGNTCRSPMAEAIARHLMRTADGDYSPDVFFASAGTHAAPDAPVTREAVDALARRGIEHRGTSKPLTAEMIRRADVVFCMTEAHVDAARSLVEDDLAQTEKLQRLNPDADIEDPVGAGDAAYNAVADELMRLVPQRVEEMLAR